jgi:hypothetical protein
MVWVLPYLFVPTVTPRITEVSLFQNGYAFVRREIDVNTSGEVRLDPLPQTVRGTFQFASTPGITIQSVTVDEEAKAEPATETTIDGLLALNKGRTITLVLTDNRTLEGQVVDTASSTTITFREGTRERILPRSLIREVISEGSLAKQTERKTMVRSLRIRYEATKPGKLMMRTLEPGAGWAPSYEATLLDDRNLRLTGRATVTNDLAPLDGTATELITGVPNIRYAGVLDPLIAAVARTPMRGGTGLVGESIDFISYDPSDNSLVVNPAPASAMPMRPTGQGLGTAEELFRHQLPPLTLGRGARAQFTLFEAKTSYRELFTWDVELSDDPQAFWRTIRFPNNSGRPLAAGAASAYRDEQLLGQDLLPATPSNAEAELRLTRAAEVRGEALEVETGRKEEPAEPYRARTFRVTIQGYLRITNAKDKAVPVRIRRAFNGTATDKDGAAERRMALTLRQRDPLTELTWTLDIPAGQTKTLKYSYEMTAQ